jgi:hypothetical protein
VNARDKEGSTALSLAENYQIRALLKAHGAR